jgi:enoyl-[acyl-carrier protein] reductase I
MGLLDGRTALIFGVANDHSIAWGIAQALHAEGAEVGFSSVESLLEKRVRPLAASIGSTFVEPCDVQSDEQVRAVFARWGETHDSLDILVHALAFARREDLEGGFVTSREACVALDVSAHSLVVLARTATAPAARLLDHDLTYYAPKVVANYNDMGSRRPHWGRRSRISPLIWGRTALERDSAGPVRTLGRRDRRVHDVPRFMRPLQARITPEDGAERDLPRLRTSRARYRRDALRRRRLNVVGVPTVGDGAERPAFTRHGAPATGDASRPPKSRRREARPGRRLVGLDLPGRPAVDAVKVTVDRGRQDWNSSRPSAPWLWHNRPSSSSTSSVR